MPLPRLFFLLCSLFISAQVLAESDGTMMDSNTMDGNTMSDNSMAGDSMSDASAMQKRSTPAPAAQHAAALAMEQSPDTEIIWLETGEETQLGLFMQTGAAESYGGVLLFPDSMAGPDWPDIIRPLRMSLSDQGWNTLSVALPDPTPAPIPQRDMSGSMAGDSMSEGDAMSGEAMSGEAMSGEAMSESKPGDAMSGEAMSGNSMSGDSMMEKGKTPEAYQKKFMRITSTASNQLADRGQTRQIIIGVGTGAVWAATYVAEMQQQQNIRLLMIDPRPAEDPEAPSMADLIPQFGGTVMDLYFANDASSLTRAKQRLRISKRNTSAEYLQVKVNQRPDDSKRQQQWLARKVRGILKTHIIDADEAKTLQSQLETKAAMQLEPGG